VNVILEPDLLFVGLTSIESAMELTKFLTQEDHFTVWDVVLRHLRKPYNMFGGNATSAAALKVN